MRNLALLVVLIMLAMTSACVTSVRAQTPEPTPTPLRQPQSPTSTCALTAPAAPGVHHLTDLLPGCDYAEWFEENTGYQPDEVYFSNYKILPWGNTLYLGFGKARPAEFDGSLFARYQTNALTAIYQPSEQGFIDMTPDISLSLIHIPGPDPTDPGGGGSQWDWGNTYVYTPTTNIITKHRNLPDVIHTWGLESTAAGLYAAVSSHMGDYATWTGEVFRSTDQGASWTRIADKSDGVGAYRTYDIIQFNGKLYVVWNDVYGGACGLAESSDGGLNWTRLSSFTQYTTCRTRLFIYDSKLIVLGSARDGVLALHSDGSVSIHHFVGFHAQDWVYNPFALDAANRLYVVSEAGGIWRTSDLNAWKQVVASDRNFITMSYWPDVDKIVVGDRGVMGRLWLLDPGVSAITPPATPVPTISVSGNDIILQWTAQSGENYRIYRSAQTSDFTPPIQYLHAIASGGSWTDIGAGAQPGVAYYQVRSIDIDGDISGATRTMGKFTFELTPGS